MRERVEQGAMETKVVTPEEIVFYKCCLPSSILAGRRILTQMFFNLLTNVVTHCYVLSVTSVTVYVTYVANTDKGQ